MRRFGTTHVDLARGDITREAVDAIVNAANSSLLGGGGVDGAIHRAGGPAILEECRRIREAEGPLPAGQAVITAAGRLPCRWVVHTVGPVWRGGQAGEADTLADCYRRSLEVAAGHGAKTVAFPSISTGAFGYPVAAAAAVALAAVRESLLAGSSLALVRFVLWSDADLAVYRTALAALPADHA
jgi:O-acetyl-ADP-ribose deacetylase